MICQTKTGSFHSSVQLKFFVKSTALKLYLSELAVKSSFWHSESMVFQFILEGTVREKLVCFEFVNKHTVPSICNASFSIVVSDFTCRQREVFVQLPNNVAGSSHIGKHETIVLTVSRCVHVFRPSNLLISVFCYAVTSVPLSISTLYIRKQAKSPGNVQTDHVSTTT